MWTDLPSSATRPTTDPRPGLIGSRLHAFLVFGRKAVACGVMVEVVLRESDRRPFGVAQARRRFDQRVEHGLQIEGRAADDLEHVGGGGLLLQQIRRAAR